MPASDLKQGCQLADPIFKLQCWQAHVRNNRIIEHNSQRICWMGSSSSVLHTPSVSVTFLAIPSATCSINDCSSGRLLILLLILCAFQQKQIARRINGRGAHRPIGTIVSSGWHLCKVWKTGLPLRLSPAPAREASASPASCRSTVGLRVSCARVDEGLGHPRAVFDR